MRSAKVTPYLTPKGERRAEKQTSSLARVSRAGGANGKIALSKEKEREIRRSQKNWMV